MADLAFLGLAVDSSAVVKSTSDLTRFSQAAKQVGSDVESGTSRANKALKATEQQIGLARHEMTNLGRQGADVFVSLTSGQSPFMVLIQQGAQIVDVFTSTKAQTGSVSQQFLAMITPLRLAAAGIAGVGAAALGAIAYTANWVKGLDDLSRTAGASADSMLRLQQAAAIKGINQQDFAAGITQFANQVYLAKNGLGELGEFLRANGKSAKDFDTAFANVASIIARGRDDMEKLQLLQRAGLPATMEWVRLLQQGPEGLRQVKEQLQGTPEQFDELVKRARDFDEMWNKAWTNFATFAKASIASVVGEMAKLKDAMPFSAGDVWEKFKAMLKATGPGMAVDFWSAILGGGEQAAAGAAGRASKAIAVGLAGSLAVGSGPAAAKPTVTDPNILKGQLAQYQSYVGVLGELATVNEQVKAKQNEITQANLAGAGVNTTLIAQIKELARIRGEERRAQEGVTNGIFDETKARALIDAQIELEKSRRDSLINGSLEKEQAMRTALIDKMKEQRTAAMAAGTGLPQLSRMAADAMDAKKQIDEFATKSLGNLENALVDIASGTKTAAEAFKAMTDAILKDLARLLIRQSITGPLAQSLTGVLGGLFKPSANGNAFGPQGVIPFANGGIVSSPTLFKFASGTGLMGEAGPEAIMPLKRGASGRLGVEMAGSSGGGTFAPVYHIDARGADPAAIARLERVLEKHGRALQSQGNAMRSAQYAQSTGVGVAA